MEAHLLGHHDLDELLVVDLAVTVNVGLADHLIDLLVGELLAKVGLRTRGLRVEAVSYGFGATAAARIARCDGTGRRRRARAP